MGSPWLSDRGFRSVVVHAAVHATGMAAGMTINAVRVTAGAAGLAQGKVKDRLGLRGGLRETASGRKRLDRGAAGFGRDLKAIAGAAAVTGAAGLFAASQILDLVRALTRRR